jgi:uncharacterized membrane protein (DUF4010 family)
VLPLVPDEGVGPNDALNPATVGAMGSRARAEPELRRPAVGAAVASTVATVVLLAIVLAATSAEALLEVAVPLILGGIAAAGYAAVVARRVMRSPPPESFDRGRAFDLRTVAVLAGVVSGALLAAGALNEAIGSSAVTVATGITGFADSQSAAVSASSLVAAGRISPEDAVIPILVAFSTNTVSKAVVARTLGDRRYAVDVWLGLAIVLAATWVGWAITRVAGV